ncbi:protocatechuate 3,4-dioxygenase subunit alpha [Leifsonia sp. fls2-241-R2A-40a]|uniref:protocatechuate 3,4-dioxygenase subunit alpha n=1 Tax=Leifsonia sp. fls2-241-R2A-40a TaxID=3040290 RepID=UPI00254ADC00|nr:protocatechuate 3,4-dioxygenase subunit alpha [Leifsonia sp. fls2-241-R2A-40a]
MPDQGQFLQTPSQTVGPFFGYALPYDGDAEVTSRADPDAIRLHGAVFDGAGVPVPDAILEIWGPDAAGTPIAARGSLQRDGYTVTGFGRAAVDRAGRYTFTTVLPGATAEGRAPYLLVTVFARGLLHHLFTRAYFSEADPFLATIPEDRRSTLLVEQDGPRSYRFDIRLQGDGETVFFDFVGDGRG